MRRRRIAQTLALGEMLVALPLYDIYTGPFQFFGMTGYWAPMNQLANLLSIVFVILPLLALYGVSKERTYGYWSLGLFPVVALVFGITALPLVKYLYGSKVTLNTVCIVIINLAVTTAALWLYRSRGLRFN